MKNLLLSLALMAAPALANANDYQIGDLTISHTVAQATPATAMTGAGYLEITNNGAADDYLVAIEASFPRVMVHNTKVENDVAMMFHVENLVIPAGETVTFAQGGLHVMFMGLNGDPFLVGETIPAMLIFENAGSVAIEFDVKDMNNH